MFYMLFQILEGRLRIRQKSAKKPLLEERDLRLLWMGSSENRLVLVVFVCLKKIRQPSGDQRSNSNMGAPELLFSSLA